MTDIARLDYMANENELYVIRPRENSISKSVLILDICRKVHYPFYMAHDWTHFYRGRV